MLPIYSHDHVGPHSGELFFLVGCWLDPFNVCPSQKHQEYHIDYPMEAGYGAREENAVGWQRLLPSSLFVSPLTGLGRAQAKHGQT